MHPGTPPAPEPLTPDEALYLTAHLAAVRPHRVTHSSVPADVLSDRDAALVAYLSDPTPARLTALSEANAQLRAATTCPPVPVT